jgi:hypothetical protein
MESTKVLTVVAVVAVAIALFGVVVTFMTVGDVLRFAGKVSTDTGNLSLDVASNIDINFTVDFINWSSGAVDTVTGICNQPVLGPMAVLTTNRTGAVSCGSWQVARSLMLENIGNTNVSIKLKSSNNATDGTTPTPGPFINSSVAQFSMRRYDWNISQNETSSCPSAPATWTPVNYTGLLGPTYNGTLACANLGNKAQYASANELRIDFNVTIPSTAPTGAKLSVITAEAFVAP